MRGYGNAQRHAAQATFVATAAAQVRVASEAATASEALDAAAGGLGAGYAVGDGTLRTQIEDLQARLDAIGA